MDLEWMNRGLCREVGGDIFFPETLGEHMEAISVCRACEVKDECLSYALTIPVVGIWGGTSERDRRKLRVRAA